LLLLLLLRIKPLLLLNFSPSKLSSLALSWNKRRGDDLEGDFFDPVLLLLPVGDPFLLDDLPQRSSSSMGDGASGGNENTSEESLAVLAVLEVVLRGGNSEASLSHALAADFGDGNSRANGSFPSVTSDPIFSVGAVVDSDSATGATARAEALVTAEVAATAGAAPAGAANSFFIRGGGGGGGRCCWRPSQRPPAATCQ
jgi:hypothetical protein